ncbi:hypothetical protein SAMN05660845_2165 [Flavobacterium swingsii]|uniref:FAR-17a/AIG1-like protein n=1 Tax=Flavobacterium swingsii TaxID=498292 RepID=A0A1I0ZBE7_9FLAO|nr:Pr6Pr family membrane protein [Flavobacterium swingsii]SFB23069.1 hypothetical protein SAMN05660845_2165 [Flavobacterium swingsii]
MEKQSQNSNTVFLAVISLASWLAVLLQLYLIIVNRVASILETIVRFFSFFTIQSNILVAICFTVLWFKPKNKLELFFLDNKSLTAITMYITIVGIVYNLILRFLWMPTGMQRITDEILHLVIPILVLIYWFQFVSKKSLEYKNVFPWLLFPFLYLIYTLVRGYFSDFYPYPFLNVSVLGYTPVFVNSFYMLIAFLSVGFLLIFSSKLLSKRSPKKN